MAKAVSLSLGRQQLERRMGYHYQNPALLVQALTHRSASQTHNYERLEFLGDALLGLIIARALYDRFPQQDEGRLTRMRATLVRQETLALVAKDLQLGAQLILSTGELKSGGHHRESILADVVEALIGAMFLDGALLDDIGPIVLTWFKRYLTDLIPGDALKDPKTRLQEWLQGRKLPLPDYQVLRIDGDAPNQSFYVSCRVFNQPEARAQAASRRYAEQAAAQMILNQLDNEYDPASK